MVPGRPHIIYKNKINTNELIKKVSHKMDGILYNYTQAQ